VDGRASARFSGAFGWIICAPAHHRRFSKAARSSGSAMSASCDRASQLGLGQHLTFAAFQFKAAIGSGWAAGCVDLEANWRRT